MPENILLAMEPTDAETESLEAIFRFTEHGKGWAALKRDPCVAARAIERMEAFHLSSQDRAALSIHALRVGAYHVRRAMVTFTAAVERTA
jgi:hypothetical protein